MRALVIRPGPFGRLSKRTISNCHFTSASCLAVASYLKHLGMTVNLWDLPMKFGLPLEEDARLNWLERIERELHGRNYDLVGLSVTSGSEYLNALALARFVKQSIPHAFVIAGGYHASIIANELVVDSPEIDAVAIGDSENVLRLLVDQIDRGHPELSKIPNLVWRERDQVRRSTFERKIFRLDELPFHDYSLLENLDRYSCVTLEGSRGCVFDCFYCLEKKLRGRRWNAKSPERLADEIESGASFVARRGGRPSFFLTDALFGANQRWTTSVCRELHSRAIDFEWGCQTRLSLMPKEVLSHMAEANCRWINTGIESGSPRMLRIMNRGCNPQALLRATMRAVEEATSIGLCIVGGFVAGYPGENVQTLNETQRYIQNLYGIASNRYFPSIHAFCPYPGTIAWEKLDEYSKRFGSKVLCRSWWKDPRYCCEMDVTPIVPSAGLSLEHLYEWIQNIAMLALKNIDREALERLPMARTNIPSKGILCLGSNVSVN